MGLLDQFRPQPQRGLLGGSNYQTTNGLTFNQRYHQDTVDQNKVLVNQDGTVTTAMIGGVTLDNGKTYNLPFYDRDSGRILSQHEAVDKWMPQIKSGEIIGYDSIEAANKAAEDEHKMMDEYARTRK